MSDELTIPVQTQNRTDTDIPNITELQARGAGFTLRTDDGDEIGITMSRSDLVRALLQAATSNRLGELFGEDSDLMAAFKNRLNGMLTANTE